WRSATGVWLGPLRWPAWRSTCSCGRRAAIDTSTKLDTILIMPTTTAPDLSRAARQFHALSDETRLEIVRLLSHGERCVCELQDVLDAAQSRLSFHLKTLKDAGLVTDRRGGRGGNRSEEHTSELQSHDHLVCGLLLEKKR